MFNYSLLIALIIVASVFTFFSLSEGVDWKYYGSYTWKGAIDEDCYYDADSVKYLPNSIIRYWDACMYSSSPGKGNLFTRQLIEMNCSDRTYRGLEFASFERSGNIYASKEEPGRWLNIIPGSGADKLFKLLCKWK